MRRLALTMIAALLAIPLEAQEHTSRWELTERFIRDVWLHPVRAVDVKILGPGPVHTPEADCEIHIGAELVDQTISDFGNIVLEPPNVCKDNRESSRAAWRAFYQTAAERECVAEGFIRVWPEHLSGGSLPSNPDHFMELHPMRSLVCGQTFAIDTRQQLAAHRDLGYKTAGQISTLARTFRLFIRRTVHPDDNSLNVVAFDYYACTYVNNSEQCAWGKPGLHNFARLSVETLDRTLRCSGGADNGESFKTILGSSRARSVSGYLSTRAQITKLYALDGTNFFASVGSCPTSRTGRSTYDVLGIFTVDPLSVVKVLDRISAENLDDEWVEVPFPVAYIVFGEMPPS
jgi:hypothetical protein